MDVDVPLVEVQRVVHRLATQTGEGRLLVVAYPDSIESWMSAPLRREVSSLDDVFAQVDVAVSDVLVVCQGRWWSALCTDQSCCPPEGRPIPHPADTSVAVSREVALDEYALRPDEALTRIDMTVIADSLPMDLADRADRALTLLTQLPDAVSPTLRAELGVLLQDVNVRDWVLLHVCEDPDSVVVDALVDLALTSPEVLRPRLAATAAAALYATTGRTIGVRALLTHADGETLAHLVETSIDMCVPPDTVRDLFTSTRSAVQARVTPRASA
jgi:hypothetical protein